ncbi:hypothetical protein GCM10020331_067760 [Ectobacillus funiculus]
MEIPSLRERIVKVHSEIDTDEMKDIIALIKKIVMRLRNPLYLVKGICKKALEVIKPLPRGQAKKQRCIILLNILGKRKF